ncbi:MAG: metal ABC transporter permease [Marinifilaceae bacterium]
MLLDLFQYEFFQNALIATLLISISCGIVGTYIVARRMVFISGGITHASFGGLGLAYYLGWPPLAGATCFALLSSLLINTLSDNKRMREDSVIGMLWSAGMAIGVLFIYLTPGYAPDLMTYLFGNILTITNAQMIYSAVLTGVILLFFIMFYRPLFYIAFDRDYCLTRNMPVTLLNAGVMIIIALTIVVSMKLAGIILIISYLTIPQVIAGFFSRHFGRQLLLSSGISVVGSVIGLLFAAAFNFPSGATIVITFLCALAVIATVFKLIGILKKRQSLCCAHYM